MYEEEVSDVVMPTGDAFYQTLHYCFEAQLHGGKTGARGCSAVPFLLGAPSTAKTAKVQQYIKWVYEHGSEVLGIKHPRVKVNIFILAQADSVDIGGAMSILGGIVGFCCSFCVIGLGIIFIFTLKDNKAQQGVMMIQQADGTIQPVGGMPMQQPGGGALLVGGAVHPAFATEQPATQPLQQSTTQQSQILPPIGGQQPPNQGF